MTLMTLTEHQSCIFVLSDHPITFEDANNDRNGHYYLLYFIALHLLEKYYGI